MVSIDHIPHPACEDRVKLTDKELFFFPSLFTVFTVPLLVNRT